MSKEMEWKRDGLDALTTGFLSSADPDCTEGSSLMMVVIGLFSLLL
jgi:hypothetical protein